MVLDRLRAELSGVVSQVRLDPESAKHTFTGLSEEEIVLSLSEALPLVSETHHCLVEDAHIWVAVREAGLTVLSDAQHGIMTQLRQGMPIATLSKSYDWNCLSAVIGKLASAGFVNGLTGYREHAPQCPGRFARLHLTRACQLECSHCYADSSPQVDRRNELTTARWKVFLRDFARAGGERALFTGGEALMHNGCIELMYEAKQLGLHVVLFSNGLLVPRFAKEIHASVDKVQISLDGPTAQANDEVRGRNTFQHILRALDILAEQNTPTRIGMTAVPSHWSTWLDEFGTIASRYAGHQNVEFKLSYGVMPYGRGEHIDKTDVADRRAIKEFLHRVNKSYGMNITQYQSGCGYAEQITVGPDGTVYPCHLLDAPVCHIDDHSMDQIARILTGVAKAFDVDHLEGCEHCEIRYLCGGGCRVLAGRANGTRFSNTCTAERKLQKYRNFANSYGATHQYGAVL